MSLRIRLNKYQVTSPVLKQFINFFWSIDSADVILNHEILPLKNIDLVFNLSSSTFLEKENGENEQLSNVYFHGLSESFKYKSLKKNGELKLIGVSFKPFGLYPFVGISMKEFKGLSIDFEILNKNFANEIYEKLSNTTSIYQKLHLIETCLLNIIDDKNILPKKTQELLNCFDSGILPYRIEQFCMENGIHKRQLERIFNTHIGISPKAYNKLVRYQKSLNHLIFGEFQNLTEVAYDNGYYDHMHFIRDFRQFTGTTPRTFLKKENYLKKVSRF